MRLGVNGWRLNGNLTGVGRYLLNIVKHWTPEINAERFKEINFYSPSAIDPLSLHLPRNINFRVLKPNLRMLIWDNLRLSLAAEEDVVFHPSYSIPLFRRGKTVVAIHDAIHELYPHLFTNSVKYFYKYLYRWTARNATVVITATEAGKQNIARTMNAPLSKIRVVYLAPDEIFREKPEPQKIQIVRQKIIGSNDPFFLFVGKLSGRRNIPLLLNGFAEFKRRHSLPHKLVMIGLNIHSLNIFKLLDDLNISKEIIYPGFVSDDDLNALYHTASGLISPSPYETMNLPVMEAQAAGTAVICSDTAGMREITGGNALFLPKMNKEQIAESFSQVAQDANYRNELGANGAEYSKRFTWKKTSAQTLDILAESVNH